VNAETGRSAHLRPPRTAGAVFTIENRALRPGANLYLRDYAGRAGRRRQCRLAGARRMATSGWSEAAYRRLTSRTPPIIARWCALLNSPRLPAIDRARSGGTPAAVCIVAKAASGRLIVIVLGLGGGIFVRGGCCGVIDAMTGTTQRIMAGDLSGRFAVGRSGDELDRLAEISTAMLERIEALMMA